MEGYFIIIALFFIVILAHILTEAIWKIRHILEQQKDDKKDLLLL